MMARRTGGPKEPVPVAELGQRVPAALERMQRELLEAARERREANSHRGVTRGRFIELMAGPGGFVYGGFCGSASCETEIKNETKATIRVLPDAEFRSANAPEKCMWCGGDSVAEAVWAKAY